jgi:hypothetical protein
VTGPILDIPIIDTILGFPVTKDAPKYEFVRGALGQNAAPTGESPLAYLFKDSPFLPEGADPIDHTVAEMDRWGIERAVVDLTFDPLGPEGMRRYPERFIPCMTVDPNEGMTALRAMDRAAEEHGLRAVAFSGAFVHPQVPIDDRKVYPVYAKCVELNIPIFLTVGVPGPRVPMGPQKVELLDEVCWFFPDLKIVMRHGGEPWADLAVKLMLKWPNLYYSTSGFAPRHYPPEIIRYMKTRGADKVLFAGYFAIGLTWERVFADLKNLELPDETWAKFLRTNALTVLNLASSKGA